MDEDTSTKRFMLGWDAAAESVLWIVWMMGAMASDGLALNWTGGDAYITPAAPLLQHQLDPMKQRSSVTVKCLIERPFFPEVSHPDQLKHFWVFRVEQLLHPFRPCEISDGPSDTVACLEELLAGLGGDVTICADDDDEGALRKGRVGNLHVERKRSVE